MRYIPHTEAEIKEMLSATGLNSIDALFGSIPEGLRFKGKLNLPTAMSEQELLRHLKKLGNENVSASEAVSFLGAGSYNHYIPAAIPEIVGRSEWLTPYTPYQAEISQGTLQAIFEYQSLICNLTDMEVANASHYDGSTSTAEAALMSISKTGRKNVIVSSTLHPEYRDVMRTILKPRGNKVLEMPYEANGRVNLTALKELLDSDAACFIVQSPNFFGIIEDLAEISDLVRSAGAMFIVTITDPICLGILEGPGKFGADIVTAEGQAFGCGLNYGGPYLGIFASREKYLRSMPGRIAGATTDKEGKRGFVLTMSTREQHIRREKATSNICSNEAHLALTAAVYLSLLGKQGLKKLAEINYSNAEYLKSELSKIKGVEITFDSPTFNEFVITVDTDTEALNRILLDKNIFGGVTLECWYSELRKNLLICTTECHTKEDLDYFVSELKKVLAS